jgi:hypothetical protein
MFMRVLYWALAGKYVNYGVFRYRLEGLADSGSYGPKPNFLG